MKSRTLYFFMNYDVTMSVFVFEPAKRRMFANFSLDNYNT